ncbi:hypothetical protein [Streptomyces sp. SID8352]|nr:hypothetical protein [Streptomyces sp. SID8352]
MTGELTRLSQRLTDLIQRGSQIKASREALSLMTQENPTTPK